MSKDYYPQEPIKGTCLRVICCMYSVLFCFSYLYLKFYFFGKRWFNIFNIFLFYIFNIICDNFCKHYLFLFCYERDFMTSLSDVKQAEIIGAFKSTPRYLDDLLNIDSPYFEGWSIVFIHPNGS